MPGSALTPQQQIPALTHTLTQQSALSLSLSRSVGGSFVNRERLAIGGGGVLAMSGRGRGREIAMAVSPCLLAVCVCVLLSLRVWEEGRGIAFS